MYRINRRTTNIFKPVLSTRATIRSVASKKLLKKDLNDYKTFTKKHSLERLNSIKKLTKKNIQLILNLRLLQIIKNKTDNQNNNTATNTNNNNQNNRQIYHNSILPKIPEYKSRQVNRENNILQQNSLDISQNNKESISNFDKAILQLPTRQILNTLDMAKVFNAIMNGTEMLKLSLPNKKLQLKNNLILLETLTLLQINKLFSKVMLRIQNLIFNDLHIDYLAMIKIGFNLYKQFRRNNMIKSIIMKSIDRYNRTQFYKIPDDKLKQVVLIIISLFSL